MDLGGEGGRDRRVLGLFHFGDQFGGAGGVGLHHRGQAKLAQDVAHLAQRHGVGVGALQALDRGAPRRQQAVLDAMEVLSHDEQAGLRQQVVDVGHAAGQAVLAWQHGEGGAAVTHRFDRRLEAFAGQRGHPRIGVAAGQVGIGAGLVPGRRSLRSRRLLPGVCSRPCITRPGTPGFPLRGRNSSRARSRSSAVSTPNGACCDAGAGRSACRPRARATAPGFRGCSSGDSRQRNEARQRGATEGVDADVVPARAVAPGDRLAREIQRAGDTARPRSNAQAAFTTNGSARPRRLT